MLRGGVSWLCLCLVALLNSPAHGRSICPLPWNNDSSLPNGVNMSAVCPYGFSQRGFDVTIPNNATAVEWICVGYGYIPWVLVPANVVASLFRACWNKGMLTRDASFLIFVLAMTLFNEAFLKPLLKQSRPPTSCNFTCGFPSGHSTMAMGFFSLLFLDGLFRVRPKMPLFPEHAKARAKMLKGQKPVHWLRLGWRFWLHFMQRYVFRIMPLSCDDTMDGFDFFLFVAVWFVQLIPVPFSRVILNDHTPLQVMVGSVSGMGLAAMWFTGVRHLGLRKHNHKLGTRMGGIFIHNYALPRFEVYSRCLCRLAEYEEDSVLRANEKNLRSTTDNAGEDSRESLVAVEATPKRRRNLVRMQQELVWYIEHTPTQVVFDEDRLHYEIEAKDFLILKDRLNRFQLRMARSRTGVLDNEGKLPDDRDDSSEDEPFERVTFTSNQGEGAAIELSELSSASDAQPPPMASETFMSAASSASSKARSAAPGGAKVKELKGRCDLRSEPGLPVTQTRRYIP